MTTYYTADLHDGHKSIGDFRRIPQEFLDAANGDGCEANSLWLDAEWEKAGITKRDVVIVLGDAAFNTKGLSRIGERRGMKKLIGGNHDNLHAENLLSVFQNIYGCRRNRKLGNLSHFPIHPAELRGSFAIHGHVHLATIPDHRYINVSCDNLFRETGKALIKEEDLLRIIEERKLSKEVTY